ncbi:MAG: amidohydrolase family protein [Cyclobacteriaceae bacterium]
MKHNLSFLFLAFVLANCSPKEEIFDDAICIQNINTIDLTDGLKENQTVIIKSGKILRIANSNELRLAPSNEIIDGTGKYMIPGLWDTHVHFSYIEELAPSMFDLFLLYGITSVRDTGGRIEFVKEWKDKALASPTTAPRVMIAGPLLDGMPNVYDGSDPGHPPLSVGLATEDEVANQIEMLDSMGVDFLKAYEMLTPQQFAKVTELAKAKGLKVTGHVPLSMSVVDASNGGLNSMEHMRNLELSCASNAAELLDQRRKFLDAGKKDPGGKLRSSIHQAQRQEAIENYDEAKADEVLAVLAQNQTWQIPTMALNTGFVNRPFMQPHWQESFTLLPDTISNQWNHYIGMAMEREVPAFTIAYSRWMKNMVSKIHDKGIGIMAGTDTPIGFLTPGLSLHEELKVLVDSGLSPQEALKTATLNPAIYFGMEDELGSIRENMWADLLILDANPLEDIQNTRAIRAVVKQGNYLDEQDLNEIRDRLKDD